MEYHETNGLFLTLSLFCSNKSAISNGLFYLMMSDLISSFASFFLIKNIHSIVLVTVYLSSLFSNKKCMLTALIEKSTDFFYAIMYRNMYVEQMNGWDWNICSQSAINGFPGETIVVYNTLLWFLTQFVWYMMIWTSYTFYRHVWDVIIQPCSTLNILCGLFVSKCQW